MAAHRRKQRSAGLQGLVRASAVTFTVAAAAVATACGGPRSDASQSLSVASAPDAPTDQGISDMEPMEAPTATASPVATASAAPPSRPSSGPSAPVAKHTAAAKAVPRPATTTAAAKPGKRAEPAMRAKPVAQKSASAAGSSGFRTGYPTGGDARAAVKAAVAAARADGKKVLIDFGANWCGNCKAADEVFATKDVGALLDASYHVVKVDIGGDDSAAFSLLSSYCSGEGAYKMPVLVVLDGKGRLLTETYSTGNPDLTDAGLGVFLKKWA
ncbi:thioredoxin family protein [Streptomyces showdoensis]|uniref:thioredoxin family protein n=1 Tax=Streptomyces showdoensis TaxID=68268 RepID=UPI000F4EB5F7|nr:thioredoxin family protein [Streptomyces showdoensis]